MGNRAKLVTSEENVSMNNKIKSYIKQFKMITRLYEIIFTPIHASSMRRERRKQLFFSYGQKNPNKTFLIIRCDSERLGPFSFILFRLGVLKVAEKHRMIPVFDFKNIYMCMFQDEDRAGKENAWEYYFEQPVKVYSVDDVMKSKKVYLFDKDAFLIPRYDTGIKLLSSINDIKEWSYYFNKYIRLNERLTKRVEKEYEAFQNRKVLGIAYRALMAWGEATNCAGVRGHSRVPKFDELIRIIDDKLEEWGYECFFFMTEDRFFHNEISRKYKEKCITIERPLFNFFYEGVPVTDLSVRDREFKDYTVRQKNEDYITEVYLLSKCDSLYATIEGGTICATIINGGRYKFAEYYRNGNIQ